MKLAVAQDFITKNPCDFCKPPKRVKTPINALSRGDRSRMLLIARRALPTPLSIAIELALTTGMRRGEVCALRWSDLGNDGTITVNRALGNADGGFYEKEPKTLDSKRTIPPTAFTARGARGDQGGQAAHLQIARRQVRRPLHLGHHRSRQQALQPDAAWQGLRRLLQR